MARPWCTVAAMGKIALLAVLFAVGCEKRYADVDENAPGLRPSSVAMSPNPPAAAPPPVDWEAPGVIHRDFPAGRASEEPDAFARRLAKRFSKDGLSARTSGSTLMLVMPAAEQKGAEQCGSIRDEFAPGSGNGLEIVDGATIVCRDKDLVIHWRMSRAPSPPGTVKPVTKVRPMKPLTVDPSPPEPAAAPACCRYCRTGKPCGNSCISSSKTCRSPPGCAC